MRIKDLVAALPGATVAGAQDREITGIAYDSRRVMPGMVFVAVRGLRVDGHAFIDQAVDRGAAAVICEQNGSLKTRATQIRVPDTREALARAALRFYEHPSARMKVIGITGTNGKTVVAFMVKQILEAAGIKTGLMGTVHYEVGDRIIPAQRTTPEALELQQTLAQMLRADCQACVMEVSSHALAQKRVFGVEFDVAIFTNLTQDHLDYHGSMEDYFQTKQRLFASLAHGAKSGTAVINIDDVSGARLAERRLVEVQLTYGLQRPAQLRATNIRLDRAGSQFDVETPAGRFPCRLPLIGRHNVYNALAATGAGLALAASENTIQSALDGMSAVPGRLEAVDCGQPFAVFVDYAHTDDALQNVLTALREITRGKVRLMFGCGGNRDPRKRAPMGRVAAQLADQTLLTSDNPRQEDPAAIAEQINEGFRQVHSEGCAVELDRQQAIQQILSQAQPGDTILLAGKGHESYQEFEDTVVPFDDRMMARESLETLGFSAGQ